jgi:TRAP-type C4-dicarboxylate transport system substrate-binding protein
MSDFAKAAQFARKMRVLHLPFTFSNTGQVFWYFTQSKLLDLFKRYTDAKVTMSLRLALVSKFWWDGLSAAEQYDVRNAARTEQKQEDQLTAVGITVYTPSAAEGAGFHNATLGLHQTLKGVPLERVEAILSAIDSYGE